MLTSYFFFWYMKTFLRFAVLFALVAGSLYQPVATLARAGSTYSSASHSSTSSSMGSRGSKTYETTPNAAPIQKTVTQKPAELAPVAVATPHVIVAQPVGFFGQHPFFAGFVGGMTGVFIGHMFFGGGVGSAVGSLLSLIIIVALIGGGIYLFSQRRDEK